MITHMVLLCLCLVIDAEFMADITQILDDALGTRRLGRAVRDNVSHAVMSLALWQCVISFSPPTGEHTEPRLLTKSSSPRSKIRVEQGMAMGCGSLLDLDHFMAAGSLRLSAATHLR